MTETHGFNLKSRSRHEPEGSAMDTYEPLIDFVTDFAPNLNPTVPRVTWILKTLLTILVNGREQCSDILMDQHSGGRYWRLALFFTVHLYACIKLQGIMALT